MPPIGIIAIGRNEGARLIACLDSLDTARNHVIYVDSGSTDGSVDAAESSGAHVVALNMDTPFTAARARNAGFAALRAAAPDIAYVQFLDGDCILQTGWLPAAWTFLDAHPDVAVVCGRRREIAPESSLYNGMIDQEWDTPCGLAKACGGDALMRVTALDAVGAYNPQLIAGEEPEMCVRLRQAGHKIWRLDAEMTLHDADMTRFGQWWKRSVRAGHAYAEGAALHGARPERHNMRELRSALIWGLGLPVLIVLGVALFGAITLGLLAVLPLQVLRLWLRDRDARQAFFLTLSKFSETRGIAQFWISRLRGRRSQLIEYK